MFLYKGYYYEGLANVPNNDNIYLSFDLVNVWFSYFRDFVC